MPKVRAWRERKGDAEADRLSELAQGIGNRFHAWAEQYNATGDPSIVVIDGMLNSMTSVYMRYATHSNIRPLGAECNLFSSRWGFAGTPDLVALADFEYLPSNTVTVADYKTSGMPGELWPLQLAAYSIMVEERGYGVGDVRAFRLDKDKPGEMGVWPYPDPVKLKYRDPEIRAAVRLVAKRAFLSTLNLWQWLHREDVPKIADQIQRGRLVPTLRTDTEADDAA
jgi:hypothetical protein